MNDFDVAAAEIIDGLGTAFVYFNHDELAEISGVFSNPWQKVEGARGPGIKSHRPELAIRTDVFDVPNEGDLIFNGSLSEFEGCYDYEVVSVRDDDEDTIATLILKKH